MGYLRILLSKVKLYRKRKGGKWYEVIVFTGGSKFITFWKHENEATESDWIFKSEKY